MYFLSANCAYVTAPGLQALRYPDAVSGVQDVRRLGHSATRAQLRFIFLTFFTDAPEHVVS